MQEKNSYPKNTQQKGWVLNEICSHNTALIDDCTHDVRFSLQHQWAKEMFLWVVRLLLSDGERTVRSDNNFEVPDPTEKVKSTDGCHVYLWCVSTLSKSGIKLSKQYQSKDSVETEWQNEGGKKQRTLLSGHKFPEQWTKYKWACFNSLSQSLGKLQPSSSVMLSRCSVHW